MFSVYDLYDLHLIFVAIRSYPDDPFNADIVSNILTVFNENIECEEINQFRKALRTVNSIENKAIYDFVFTDNKYSYFPLPFLKDDRIYGVLLAAFQEMIIVLNERNIEKTIDLADCLHNLPILIVESHYTIPKSFWKTDVKQYRSKWNGDFLRVEQKALKSKGKK